MCVNVYVCVCESEWLLYEIWQESDLLKRIQVDMGFVANRVQMSNIAQSQRESFIENLLENTGFEEDVSPIEQMFKTNKASLASHLL